MIDFNVMNRRLDEALSNETTESINNYFKQLKEKQMTNEQFNEFHARKVAESTATLTNKATEYSDGDNRFHNFDTGKVLVNLVKQSDTNYYTAWCFSVKHLVSIIDILNNPERFTPEQKAEKFGDMRNYLELMEGMVL